LPIDSTSIRKEVHTESQTRKQRYERFENATKTFTLLDKDKLRDHHILLIDDVVTTGSTLEACASALLKIRNVRLSLLTIAATY
jgi:predicted amidophosphoribosyltransferase